MKYNGVLFQMRNFPHLTEGDTNLLLYYNNNSDHYFERRINVNAQSMMMINVPAYTIIQKEKVVRFIHA